MKVSKVKAGIEHVDQEANFLVMILCRAMIVTPSDLGLFVSRISKSLSKTSASETDVAAKTRPETPIFDTHVAVFVPRLKRNRLCIIRASEAVANFNRRYSQEL